MVVEIKYSEKKIELKGLLQPVVEINQANVGIHPKDEPYMLNANLRLEITECKAGRFACSFWLDKQKQ